MGSNRKEKKRHSDQIWRSSDEKKEKKKNDKSEAELEKEIQRKGLRASGS